MVFCGSYDYPERGYLDRLATLCQGAGTNAYTTEDHTCYTFTSSSLPGMLRVLPVFLDHIMRPTFDEHIVKREIFHRNVSGEGRGVVYCEMAAREWSEQDQLDLALRKAVFGDSPSMETYRWECGGRTKDLTALQLKEIDDYHRRHYRPESVTIVLCGGKDLTSSKTQLEEIFENVQFRKDLLTFPPGPSLTLAENKIVERSIDLQFPANDESLGSIGFAWPGPQSSDLYTIMALHVLMRMLRDTSASPLYQAFVERAEPIASDIDYDIKPSCQSMISLIFSGIPTEEVVIGKDEENFLLEYTLWKRVKQVINTWIMDKDAVKDRLAVVLTALSIKLQESLEDDPHEVCAAYCAPEIVRAHWPTTVNDKNRDEMIAFGAAITSIPRILEELRSEPLYFWHNLLATYLLSSSPNEVRMHPSRQMNDQIKKWEIEQLSNIEKINIRPEVPPSITSIPKFAFSPPKSIKCQIFSSDETSLFVQLPNSNVKRFTIAFDITVLPADLLPCLVLFQELLFQSDIYITEDLLAELEPPALIKVGKTSYQTLIEDFSSQFSTFEASIGCDNELFSVGYLDSHLVISLQGRVSYTFEEFKAIAFSIIRGTRFPAGRLEEVIENLTSLLKDTWRDPSTVLDSVLVENLVQRHSVEESPGKRARTITDTSDVFVENYIGLMKQTQFMTMARHLIENDPARLVKMLENIAQSLLAAPFFTSFTEEYLSVKSNSSSFKALSYPLPRYGLLQGKIIGEGHIEVIPICDITASFMSIVLPFNLLPFENRFDPIEIKKFLSTAIICQLVSYTEGPLYRRIRGAGLAYGASLSMAVWNGLFSFNLNDSTDPVKSLAIFHDLISEILSEADSIVNDSSDGGIILNEEAIRTAQAVQLYQFVAERSTPASIFATAFRCQLRGLPPIGSTEETIWNELLLKLSLMDVSQCALEILPAFLERHRTINMLAVPSAKVDSICDHLYKANMAFIIRDVCSMSMLLEGD